MKLGRFNYNIFFTLFCFILSSCFSRYDDDPLGTIPRKNLINMDNVTHKFAGAMKDASSDFRQGWYDGCETGMHSGDNSFYKMFSKSNKQDGWKMVNSKDYSIAWNYAYWVCYRSEYVDMKSSGWGHVFTGFQ